MKFVIIFSALFAVALSRPQQGDRDAVILKYDSDNIGVDGYNYAYETSNSISANEQGTLNNAGTENEAIAARGQFSYQGPDGVVYQLTYIADENGFQAQGAHLPSAPS